MVVVPKTSYIPPIPQPPHDPTWWLLNARVGWRGDPGRWQNVEQAPGTDVLTLAPVPGTGRSLVEEGGGFGGLTLPANVALGPDDRLYLLDSATLALKRFDPCHCQFEVLPCFGGDGPGPRQLHLPGGIAICGGNLFVCDTGNRRLSVFSLWGLVLRGFWKLPADLDLEKEWEPFAVACDSRERVFVTDGANGCIHRFSPRGCYEACLGELGLVTDIAIDCRDHVYVVVEGEKPSVRVLDAEGESLGAPSRPEEVATHFAPLPFPVDANGNLYLGDYCDWSHLTDCGQPATTPATGVFDQHGNPVTDVPPPSEPMYHKKGIYLSEPLDSKRYRCQWHRIVLQGQIPPGARIHVATFTSEVPHPADDILLQPEDAWETDQTAYEMGDGAWDCLVRSGGGRYLWLRLTFRGNGSVTPAIENVRVEYPRVSLRRYLPAVFGEDPGGADLTDRFLSIFDTTLRGVEWEIDNLARYFDPLSAPAEPDPASGVDFLSWLASWIGLSLDRHWPEARRRLFVKQAAHLYHSQGTLVGLRQQLLLYMGLDVETMCCPDHQPRARCRPKPANCAPVETPPCAWQPPAMILEHYRLRRWLFSGVGRLGDQSVLWGERIVNRSQLDEGAQVGETQLITSQDPFRDPFHHYAHKFTVFIPACYGRSARGRKGLDRLIRIGKPAHTHFQIEYVEPRFRIGVQSMIGFDAVIGRYPQGVTLAETPLGEGSVLTGPADKKGGPSLEIGKDSRVGTTTVLD